ncbi:hypothetical protein TrST_g10051 [Triparma strigata]|uniref:Uncharacterized protein n=1 Tax=Triparma strigata TaxID=1606541 RepID=A0A9W7EJ89_9STRA|nr:hypothetical protein TrST_g10051 [Triparma strigata]
MLLSHSTSPPSPTSVSQNSPSSASDLRIHTPLHKLTASVDNNPKNHTQMLARLSSNPEETQVRNVGGWLAIHYATGREMPLNVVREFIAVGGAPMLLEHGGGGWLPLHYASRHCEEAVVKYLAEVRPEALEIKNDFGKYPVDVAISEKRSSQLIAYLSQSPSELLSRTLTEDIRASVKMSLNRICKMEIPGIHSASGGCSTGLHFFKIVAWLKQGREMDEIAENIVEYLGVGKEEAGEILRKRREIAYP